MNDDSYHLEDHPLLRGCTRRIRPRRRRCSSAGRERSHGPSLTRLMLPALTGAVLAVGDYSRRHSHERLSSSARALTTRNGGTRTAHGTEPRHTSHGVRDVTGPLRSTRLPTEMASCDRHSNPSRRLAAETRGRGRFRLALYFVRYPRCARAVPAFTSARAAHWATTSAC